MALLPDLVLPSEVLDALRTDINRLPMKAFTRLCKKEKTWTSGFRLVEKNLPTFRKKLADHVAGPAPISDEERACLRENGLNMECVCVFSISALTEGFDALAGFLGGARLVAAMLVDERKAVRDFAVSVVKESRALSPSPSDPSSARESLIATFAPFVELLSSVLLPPVEKKIVRASAEEGNLRAKIVRAEKKIARLEALLRKAEDEARTFLGERDAARAACAEAEAHAARSESARKESEEKALRAERERSAANAEWKKALADLACSEDARNTAERKAESAEAARHETMRRVEDAERARREAENRADAAEVARHEAERRAETAEIALRESKIGSLADPSAMKTVESATNEIADGSNAAELRSETPGASSGYSKTEPVPVLDSVHAELEALLGEFLPTPAIEESGPAAVLSRQFDICYRREDFIMFLIDGHNVMNLGWPELSLSRTNGMSHAEVRDSFVGKCKRLVLGFPNSSTIVFFDGDRPGHGFSSNHFMVEYSGNPENEAQHRADRAIVSRVNYLHREKGIAPENVIVVSSDQGLCRAARLAGAMTIGHNEFLAVLDECR